MPVIKNVIIFFFYYHLHDDKMKKIRLIDVKIKMIKLDDST